VADENTAGMGDRRSSGADYQAAAAVAAARQLQQLPHTRARQRQSLHSQAAKRARFVRGGAGRPWPPKF